MCYKCSQRMASVPPIYDRCTKYISAINHDLYLIDRRINDVSRQLPSAILVDPEFAEILESYARTLCEHKDRLLKRKSRCENWYFHCFPLYDLLAPTDNGASSQ